ncbi:hypothetical protein CBR_g38840 [Chara braunii]|uniref:Uncharacterized protein n=1 Tax=Chara braunii TaxID=69332 RepID=A0A388LQE7_CHABU|nr:hypothetical protein CBR_g38840 [Chara braunii]|eukprot:GBG84558.1 hypothetical protein CBR_g38840 [Chara braunii]
MGANATPMLTLPAPTSTSSNVGYAVSNNQAAFLSSGYPNPFGRSNFWRANQEKLDRCFAKTVADEEKEAERKEEEKRNKILKEEEERKEEWRKERERLEAEITDRLDKRMEEKNSCRLKEKGSDDVALKEELEKIRKENEKLRSVLTSGDGVDGTTNVSKLQVELAFFRRQVLAKRVMEDDVFAMKKEIDQLRTSALARGSFQSELDSLRSEVSRLKIQGVKDREQVELWKREALRPGNKRGSVAIETPEVSNMDLLGPDGRTI